MSTALKFWVSGYSRRAGVGIDGTGAMKKNRYLCTAHETQLEDGRKVLPICWMWMNSGPEGGSLMEYITADTGGKKVYIEKTR